jgi:hypothetical protein
MSEARWLSWSEIARIAQTRRVVAWGKSEWLKKALAYLPAPPAYIVDNNPHDQGNAFEGIPIRSPAVLREEPPGSVFVLITSTGFEAIFAQIDGYGLRPGADYSVSPTLRDYKVIAALRGHEGTVYFSASDPPADRPDGGGGLYRYTVQEQRLEKLVSGLCHGIVEGRDGLVYLVDDGVLGLRVLDRDMKTVGTIELPRGARPHGLGYCPKRHRLYVVVPAFDAIAVIDADSGRELDRLCYSDKGARAGTPQHHPNDCCAYADSLYSTMFSLSGNWKIGAFDGAVCEWDLDTHERRGPVVQGLWMPHTPTVIDGALHWADSMRGEVRSTSWKVLGAFHGFVRGIAHDGRVYYIGQSQHRYVGRRLGTADNISLDSGIFLLDPETKATRFHPIDNVVDINSVYVPSAARRG